MKILPSLHPAKRSLGLSSAVLLSACASVSDSSKTGATGIDGQACVGTAPAVIDGLAATSNAARKPLAMMPGTAFFL